MSSSEPVTVLDEVIASGLRYTEEVTIRRSHPLRYCYLWQESEEIPVSELEVHSFQQRFGAVAVAAEGIGGAETPPPYRRRGYMRQLVLRATAGMAQRVPVAFVSDAIESMYEKFGYATALVEGHLVLKVHNVERYMERAQVASGSRTLRPFTLADLPAMVSLYNASHDQRSWTHLRQSDWNRLEEMETWKPGSAVLLLVEGEGQDEEVVGYAITKDHFYGWTNLSVGVDEMIAKDEDAAMLLLAEVSRRCWQARRSEFEVHEPLDSIVGYAARRIGCDYRQSFPTTGWMMGAILNRAALLEKLEPELRRRLPGNDYLADHEKAFPALQQGLLLEDNTSLLRLLLGDWSLRDLQANHVNFPPHFTGLFAAWFPGGGSTALPMPYAHKLDRY